MGDHLLQLAMADMELNAKNSRRRVDGTRSATGFGRLRRAGASGQNDEPMQRLPIAPVATALPGPRVKTHRQGDSNEHKQENARDLGGSRGAGIWWAGDGAGHGWWCGRHIRFKRRIRRRLSGHGRRNWRGRHIEFERRIQ
jgi:hypothetical protein